LKFWITALASDAKKPLLVTLLLVETSPARVPVTVREVSVAFEKWDANLGSR
jgi:hypothetical protein